MTDDLFERLRTVDPATDERIAQETRALGTTPGRIVEGEPSNVRRFPNATRRKAGYARSGRRRPDHRNRTPTHAASSAR